MNTDPVSRRHTLAGAVGVGLALPVLAACSSESSTSPGSGSAAPSVEVDAGALASAEDIPVGGGEIFADAKVVVTQPSEGEFRGFSGICTHQGCVVSSISDGTINCRCHGSKFSIEDGSVQGGPASAPLPSVELSVDAGGEISIP
ncbi:Rieske (2Fe-2S) protein [Nocardioides sp.]|uniref:Rieske (2Fe-2S) protein n=1 Tax=Nocardioides sp. TaxID=35761 RepID=UPI003566DE21